MEDEHNPVRLQSADYRTHPLRFSDLNVGGHKAHSNAQSVLTCLRLHPEVSNRHDVVLQIVNALGRVVMDDAQIREGLQR
jgi:hypothetical protein